MDDEMRERIAVACTEVAMMMEELSVTALGAAEMEAEQLPGLLSELRSHLRKIHLRCSNLGQDRGQRSSNPPRGP